MTNLDLKPTETWRMRKRKPRICKFCGQEIPWGTLMIRYTGGKYHPDCAIKAGIRKTIA